MGKLSTKKNNAPLRKIYTLVRYPEDYAFLDTSNLFVLLISFKSQSFLNFHTWNKGQPIKRMKMQNDLCRKIKFSSKMNALCVWSHEYLGVIFLGSSFKVFSFENLHNLTCVEFVDDNNTVLVGRVNEPSFALDFSDRSKEPTKTEILSEYLGVLSLHYDNTRGLLIAVTTSQLIVQNYKNGQTLLSFSHDEDACIRYDPHRELLLTFRADSKFQTATNRYKTFTIASFWKLEQLEDLRVKLKVVCETESEKMDWERMVFVEFIGKTAIFVCFETGNMNPAILAMDYNNGEVIETIPLKSIHEIMSCVHFYTAKKKCFVSTVLGRQFLYVLPQFIGE